MIIKNEDVESAVTLLGITGYPLTAENVNNAYRKLAKEHHPDTGGDMGKFVAVDRAKHILLEHLKRSKATQPKWTKPDCPNCGGKGRVMLRRGFATMTVTCGRCKGSGDADWDADVVDP